MSGQGMVFRALALLALCGAAGCASMVGSTESTVAIRTNPANAQCDLKGHDGFSASVTAPSSISIPNAASPVTVVCKAPGFRATSYTLDATADGWIWGNSAFLLATGGVAVLGALVDETRSAGKAYDEEVQYELTPDRPRPVRVRSRDGGVDMDLQAR